jgi:hypothetical protein
MKHVYTLLYYPGGLHWECNDISENRRKNHMLHASHALQPQDTSRKPLCPSRHLAAAKYCLIVTLEKLPADTVTAAAMGTSFKPEARSSINLRDSPCLGIVDRYQRRTFNIKNRKL